MKDKIEQAINTGLIHLGVPDVEFVLERPMQFAHGDYSTNAAMVGYAKEQDKFKTTLKRKDSQIITPQYKNPYEFAEALKSEIDKIAGIKKIEVVRPGFLNFWLTHEALMPKEQEIRQIYSGKLILLEYTSPNLFKPLHIGNLIGNILGESLARLFEVTGATVKRINYPSDIGLTIAKGVWGLQKLALNPNDIEQLGKAYVVGNEAYESGEAKDEIEMINRALYASTNSSNAAWHKLRDDGLYTSLKHLDRICKQLGTKEFDATIYESQSGLIGQKIVANHIGDVFEKSEGAVVYHGKHTRVFLNSQGLPTYEAKEVGLFELKTEKYPNFDVSLTVTGKEQQDFFSVVFDAVRKIFPNKTAGKVLGHIPTSFLRLTSGKMSSRLGNVITGESLIADLTKAARAREDVAIGAIKYTVLRSGNGTDIIFDPEKSLSLEGDSGPYLQYAKVRATSLLKKAKEAKQVPQMKVESDADFIEVAGLYRLYRVLVHFPEVVERAAQELEPHHITTYLTELASVFNSWYTTERIIVNGEVMADRVNLVAAVEQTLAKGLGLLGIPAPEQM